MDLRNSRWAPIGAAFLLFAVVDLLLLLAFPPPKGVNGVYLPVLLPPAVAGVVVLVTLPALLGLFERQQERIERQNKQIGSLHAMDTAIAAELELESLLVVAARETTLAVDADQAGIYLFASEETGGAEAQALHNVPADDENHADRRRFLELLRAGTESAAGTGASAGGDAIRVPIESDDQVIGYLAAARWSAAGRPPFRADDFALLRDLAGTIVVAVKNAHALERVRRVAHVEDELARERRVAEALQAGLLPDVPVRSGPYRFSKHYEARYDEALVGGDIYDLFRLDADRWGVMIADVSGKGLEAARKTAMVKYALRSYAREHASPARVAARLNDALCEEAAMTGFVTLVYGVLDANGRFTYASAGHELPFLCRRDGSANALADGRSGSVEKIEMLEPTGVVLGAEPGQRYREHDVHLRPGDGLLLYTDGLSEARNPESREFLGVDGLADIVRAHFGAAPDDFVNGVFARVTAFAGGRLSDDVAMLWIQYEGVSCEVAGRDEAAPAAAGC